MSSEKILVTGGAGFIGSHLVEFIAGQDALVTVLDNFRTGTHENLTEVSQRKNVRIICGDVTDPGTCEWACRDAATVFHLACLGVRHSLHNPVENHHVNASGTLQMLKAARAAKVSKFIYVSSSEVYGRATDFPILESTTTWPMTVYGAGKLAGEHYTRAYHECYGMDTVCVRPFNNYGPRSHFEGDAGEVIPRFILQVLAGTAPVIFGDGSNTRDFLHVKDCARALWEISHTPTLNGEVVNLGYGEEIRIDRLAELVISTIGRKDIKPVHIEPRPGDVPRLWVNPAKLQSFLKFRPIIGLEEGLVETVAYFRQMEARIGGPIHAFPLRNWSTS